MFFSLKNNLFNRNVIVCFSQTPWQLTLKNKHNNLEIFIHYKTHEEAKVQEDKFLRMGFISGGIEWKV